MKRSVDLLVFLIIVWVGRKSAGFRQSKVPSILDKIIKDATLYFLVIFTSHLLVECFVLFAPVSLWAALMRPSSFAFFFLAFFARRDLGEIH